MKAALSEMPALDGAAIRYGQCWEDADVLTEALSVQPHHTCLAIASAGDNALALLAGSPRAVVAIDASAAQLACLALRVCAYRVLDDAELQAFLGARPSSERLALYARCRPLLGADDRAFWDARPRAIAGGIGSAGRFERYFATFRRWILPLVHDGAAIASLLTPKSRGERARFYARTWNTPRWRATFRAFFSRAVMSRLGRDPRFFEFADGDLAAHLLERVRHALVELDPAANPYLRWILTGGFGSVLPFALRPENSAKIRANLDRLSWQQCSLETFVARSETPVDRFALSDVFEYMAPDRYAAQLEAIVACSAPGARLAYWNMLANRTRPAVLAGRIVPDEACAARLHAVDKAFFYRRFVVEDVA
jgi:S-adenosylmethionine-diacylglycerol 3-amino-3-carboxypropyl transferase